MQDNRKLASERVEHIFSDILKGNIYTWVGVPFQDMILSSTDEPLRTHVLSETGGKFTIFDIPGTENAAEPRELQGLTWPQALEAINEIHGLIQARKPTAIFLVPNSMSPALAQAYGVTLVEEVTTEFGTVVQL